MPTPSRPIRIWLVPLVCAACVGVLWAFPRFWYTARSGSEVHWFAERQDVPGWKYSDTPIAKAAEAALVADRMINGEYLGPGGKAVRVFSAKRYLEKSNEIGLFMHTPDRCWVHIGWRLEPSQPEVLDVNLHGVRIQVERRIFVLNRHRELVYFAGLVGGEPLPYRLDHHLSVAKRYKSDEKTAAPEAMLRASNRHFWDRLWDSFVNRRQLLGAKHFLRISTPLAGDPAAADKLLQEFLQLWLAPGDYSNERNEWKVAARNSP